MKAFPGLLAVLLMLSSASLAQTAPPQPAEPPQQAAPVQQAAPAEDPTPPQPIVAESPNPPPAVQPAPAPETPPAAIPSTEPPTDHTAALTGDVPAVTAVSPARAFAPGVKLFVEPMHGFGDLLTEAIKKKKVPVILVDDRDKADFVLTGEAYIKKPGWLKSNFVYLHGHANISAQDAHTGNAVFTYASKRIDANLLDGEVYAVWAGGCANHLKKALQKR